jgi:tripartite-type tricarboxylate transporter receptor subunit TctC
LISFLPVIRDGRVRALGMSTAVRSPLLPELPTISEGGVPGYEASSWIMVAAPAGTPQNVTQSLAVAIRRIADAPDFRARIAELGAEPVAGTPAEAKAFVEEEAAKWQRVIAKTGVRVD